MSSTSCDIWQFGISSARIMFSLWFLFLWCFPVLGSFFFSSSVCSVTFIFLCCQNPRKFFKSPPHSPHSKRCWKHSFETLIHVNINVPHTICKSIVSCKLKQKKKRVLSHPKGAVMLWWMGMPLMFSELTVFIIKSVSKLLLHYYMVQHSTEGSHWNRGKVWL